MILHPWRDISPGTDAPRTLNTIVEIPRGGTVKYELDRDSGLLRMDRVLFSAVHFPANYGFIPQTLAEDGDPLDILVLCQFAVQPLTLMQARPIGLITMTDAGQDDHKIIAVAVSDPEYNAYPTLGSLPEHRVRTIRHFFRDYKSLERSEVEVGDVRDVDEAHEVVVQAITRYQHHGLASTRTQPAENRD